MGKARGPGPRSFEALSWLERLEVAGLEPFALAHGFGQRAAYSHVERLASAGLVERVYDREGSLIAITRAGRRAVRPDIYDGRPARTGPTGASGRAHLRAVSWAATRATLRGLEWVSEREMRGRAEWQVPVIWNRRGTHRPDLGVIINGDLVAFEVELTAKSPDRLRTILDGYEHQVATGRLNGVYYLSDRPAVLRGVERAAAAAGLSPARFGLVSLAEFQAEIRRQAAAARAARRTSEKASH